MTGIMKTLRYFQYLANSLLHVCCNI